MIEKLIVKYSDCFFRVIGIGFIIHSFGLILFGGIDITGVDSFIEMVREFLKIILLLISVVAGVLAIRLKIFSGWSWVMVKLMVSLAGYQASILGFIKMYRDSKNGNDLFGLINAFDIDPLEEIKTGILRSTLVLILIGILLIPPLIKKYEISQMKIYISVCLGIVLSILLVLVKLDFNTDFM